jgi:hypothetical protein
VIGQIELERWRHDVVGRVVDDDAAPGDLDALLSDIRRAAAQRELVDAVAAIDGQLAGLLGPVGPHRLTIAVHPGPAPVVLGHRFGEAVTLAADLHGRQTRKQTSIPYVAHLLGAAAYLLEQPGTTEDQAIAALLHDAIEDQGDQITLQDIEQRFGAAVARMVGDCTDADTDPKPPWPGRKAAYLLRLQTVGRSSLQVSLADKLHNATAILRDHHAVGTAVWDRFSAPPSAQHWYYTSLAEVFTRRLGNQLSHSLARTVHDMFDGVDLGADPDMSA